MGIIGTDGWRQRAVKTNFSLAFSLKHKTDDILKYDAQCCNVPKAFLNSGGKKNPPYVPPSTCRLLRKDLGQDSIIGKPKLWKWKRLVPALVPDFSSVFYFFFFPSFLLEKCFLMVWSDLLSYVCLNRSETGQFSYWAMQIQPPTHPNGTPKSFLVCRGQGCCHPSCPRRAMGTSASGLGLVLVQTKEQCSPGC